MIDGGLTWRSATPNRLSISFFAATVCSSALNLNFPSKPLLYRAADDDHHNPPLGRPINPNIRDRLVIDRLGTGSPVNSKIVAQLHCLFAGTAVTHSFLLPYMASGPFRRTVFWLVSVLNIHKQLKIRKCSNARETPGELIDVAWANLVLRSISGICFLSRHATCEGNIFK